MENNNLFNLTPSEVDGLDGAATVRQNVWLLTSNEVSPLLLSVDCAARCLGVDAREVEQLVANNELSGVEVGGQLAIRASSLGRYVAGLVPTSAVATPQLSGGSDDRGQ